MESVAVVKLQNVLVSNCKMHVSQIAQCICLKLQNVFVSNRKMYLSQIAKCINLNFKMYLSKFQNIFV